MRYPVYFFGKKIGEWNPLSDSLWEIVKPHISRNYYLASDYLAYLHTDKVMVVLKSGTGA